MAKHEGLSDDVIRERISELGVTYVAKSNEEGFKVAHNLRVFIIKLDIGYLIEGFLLDF